METKSAIEVVNHASQMSDRWLFLAAIVFILLGGVTIVRYLVNQLESQRASHNSLMEKTVVALYESTQVMKDVKELLQQKNALALIFIAGLSLMFGGCSTTVDEKGFRTYANVSYVEYHRMGPSRYSLIMRDVNHSTPTRAAGALAGTIGTAVTSAITAAATGGAVR